LKYLFVAERWYNTLGQRASPVGLTIGGLTILLTNARYLGINKTFPVSEIGATKFYHGTLKILIMSKKALPITLIFFMKL
jgi:hypothetical protein